MRKRRRYRPARRCQCGSKIRSRMIDGPPTRGPHDLVIAIDALATLVAFLSFDREGGNRPRFEPLERDRLAGLLAITVGAVLDPLQRSIDLGDQLALAIAGAKFD